MAGFAFFRVVLVALVLGLVAAQECYYPHGELAPAVEKPCSSAPGSACCPEKWECMDNGLCHYAPENLYGRYSCTDQSWKSPGCPANLCTYGMSATGGESILQCADHDDNWCCNGDGNQVKCCDGIPAPRPFFALQAPNIYGTAGGKTGSSVPTLASITGNALEGSTPTASPRSSSSPSSTMRTSAAPSKGPSTSASPSLSPPTLTPLHTSLPPPTSPPTSPTSSPPPNPAHTPHLPLILSLSLSIPLLLALTLIIIWLLRKRSHMKSHPYDYTPRTNAERFSSAPPYPGSPYAGEEKQLHIQGETGVNDPVSTIPGKAELDSGDVVEGVPYCADSVGAGMRLPIARSMVDVVPRNSEGEGAVMPFCVLGEVVSGRSTPVTLGGTSLSGGNNVFNATVPGRHLTTGAAEGWIPASATGGLSRASLVGRSLGSVQEVVELPAERTPNATPTQGRMGAVSPVGVPVGVVEMGVGRGSPV